MTRPMSEPSPTQRTAESAYAIRQLQRRPAPAVTGFIHYFRMWQYNATTIIDGSTGDGDPLNFDRWESSDPSVFDHGGITSGSPSTIQVCEAKQRGLYAITVTISFFDTPTLTEDQEVSIAIHETGGSSSYTSPPVVIHPGQPLAGDNSTGHYQMTIIRSYPPIWIAETTAALAPAIPRWRINAAVLNGDATVKTAAMAEFHLLQAYDYESVPA
jgi:hypothetical protein